MYMKVLKVIATILLLSIYGYTSAQTLNIDWREGSHFVYKTYNNKEVLGGINRSVVNKVVQDGDKNVYTLTTTATDDKGNPIGLKDKDGNINNTINREVFSDADHLYFIDVKSSMSSIDSIQAMLEENDIQIAYSGELPAIPRSPQVGPLPKCEYQITLKHKDRQIAINFNYSKRQVLDKEIVVTGAGTFDCWKVTEQFNISMFIIKKSILYTTWIADKVGIVKQETYDKSGQLLSQEILTEIK